MKTIISLALISLSLSGCVSSTSLGHGSERKQLMITSQEFNLKRAEKTSAKIKEVREKVLLDQYEQRVVKIMNRLIPYADPYLANGRNIKWDVYLYGNKKSNVGILANGTVQMSYKFLQNPKLNNDALAYILAHEISHVLREHHREQDAFRYIIKPALLGTAFATSGATSLIAGIAHDGQSRYSRKLEKEADLLGLEIMAKAGYNPQVAAEVFKNFEPIFKKEHPVLSRAPSIIASHASLEKRTEYTLAQLPQVMPLYEAAKDSAVPYSANLIQPKALLTPPKPKLTNVSPTLQANQKPTPTLQSDF